MKYSELVRFIREERIAKEMPEKSEMM